MTAYLKRTSHTLFLLLFVAALAAAPSFLSSRHQPATSVELGYAEHSPQGIVGGAVVPASCASYNYNHTTTPPGGACTACAMGYVMQDDGSCLIDNCPPCYSFDAAWLCQYDASTCPAPPPPVVTPPPPPPPPPTNPPTVTANPITVVTGDPSTVAWNCGVGDTSSAGIRIATGGATSGSVQVNPAVTTSYGVQCNPSTQQSTVTVTVQSPTLTISATPTRIHSGNASSISWSASSVTSCTVKNGATTLASCSSNGTCSSAHTLSTGALIAQSVFTLTCVAPSGNQSATATVFITPSVCEVGTPGCPE